MQSCAKERVEKILRRVARAVGLPLGKPRWEGGRLSCTVGFPGGGRRVVWVAARGTAEAFVRGPAFDIGFRMPRKDRPQEAAVDQRHLKAFAIRLSRACEQAVAPDDWPEEPVRTEEPDLVFEGGQAELRITGRCNERCIFCNTAGGAQNMVDSRDAAGEAAACARKQGARTLVISGGEPLLVPWVFELI